MVFQNSVAPAAFVLICCAIMAAGCSGEQPVAAPADVVYRCGETGEFVSAPPQPAPAINPHTGRATLQRALYCPRCKRWHVVPPPDVLNGPPAGYPCPRHNTAMQEQGPLPQ